LAEGEAPPLGACLRNTEVLSSIGTGVLVPCQVAPMQVNEEECEATNQHTGGTEVVTCLTTTTHIDVTCNTALWVLSCQQHVA
jgi:hypothetical protein